MLKRKICVVTGTRAEYGLLYWLMREIKSDPDLDLQIVVTGAHLSPEFGLTYQEIIKDGFIITAKVEMLLSSDTQVGITKSLGLGIIGFADVLDKIKPDILVLLGDRYEILAAAEAALIAKIPIAHIAGGEATEGLIDEAIRHAVTKMSHLHFVGAEPYRQRVVQLGEHPNRVFNFGTPGLDNVYKCRLLSLEELERSLGFCFGETSFLVTYHPVTLSFTNPEAAVTELLNALDYFKKAKIIFTINNADTHGRIIYQMIDNYVVRNQNRAIAVRSLGQIKYLSTIKYVNVVIGNSSSGLIEVPALKKPTVNLGIRQKGRLQAASVINCNEKAEDIIVAINKALTKEFLQSYIGQPHPYGGEDGAVAVRIKKCLKDVDLRGILYKEFFTI